VDPGCYEHVFVFGRWSSCRASARLLSFQGVSRRSRGRRIALLGAGLSALTLVGVTIAFAYSGGRWGCRSQAELERTRPPQEVVDAFADADVALSAKPLPRVVVGHDRPYQGARAYTHETERATLWVLVCRVRCAGAPQGLSHRPVVDGRRMRQFSALGNNIAVFTADNDGHSGRALQARAQHVLNDLDVAEEYGSRCYIQ
jgi:hypothetical protein